MEEKLSININLADRYYPLKIERSEEEKIRKAVKLINDKIAQYRSQDFKDKEQYDFVVMTALQFTIKYLEGNKKDELSSTIEEINKINNELEIYINQNK